MSTPSPERYKVGEVEFTLAHYIEYDDPSFTAYADGWCIGQIVWDPQLKPASYRLLAKNSVLYGPSGLADVVKFMLARNKERQS